MDWIWRGVRPSPNIYGGCRKIKKKKPAGPFKFNSDWLKEEGFISLIKEHWTPIDQND